MPVISKPLSCSSLKTVSNIVIASRAIISVHFAFTLFKHDEHKAEINAFCKATSEPIYKDAEEKTRPGWS
jgi:ribosomal protein S25